MYKHPSGDTRFTSDLCTLYGASFLLNTRTLLYIKNYEIADSTNPIYTRLAAFLARGKSDKIGIFVAWFRTG